MNTKVVRFFYWFPRAVMLLFIAFLSLFSLDVLNGDFGFPEVLLALFMHLLPALILLGFLLFAWRKEKAGGIIFLLLGALFTFFFSAYEDWVVFLILIVPIFLTGISFIISASLNSSLKNLVLTKEKLK